jgi:hypothetical protein
MVVRKEFEITWRLLLSDLQKLLLPETHPIKTKEAVDPNSSFYHKNLNKTQGL